MPASGGKADILELKRKRPLLTSGPYRDRHWLVVIVVMIPVVPMVLDNHNFLVMSVPIAIVIAVWLYNNSILSVRRCSRKCDCQNAKSYNCQDQFAHLFPPWKLRDANSAQHTTVP
jgi:hypothetical protein